jgi:ribosomal protein S12 methylthiotransferase
MKAYFISLGCPKNLKDTEFLMGEFKSLGYSITSSEKEAQIVVINTCSFLQSARDESRETISKFLKLKELGKIEKIYIAGCLPKYHEIFQNEKINGVEYLDSIDLHKFKKPYIQATPPWTAYVKIAEGCNNKCSYCLIPKIRGKLRIKSQEDILDEIRFLTEHGVKEIILISQDTSVYPDLHKLLKKIVKIKPLSWLRLMYLNPSRVSDELIKVIAGEEKICKYLDLPLQHICDKILKRMDRPCTEKRARSLIHKIREAIPEVSLRTTFLVGFPGETDEDFERLLDFVKEVKFENLGAFVYSRENGTKAANLGGQIKENIKVSRWHSLMNIQNQISKENNNKLIGKELEILLEDRDTNSYIGRSYREAPEIDGSVILEAANKFPLGEFVKAKISSSAPYKLYACLSP